MNDLMRWAALGQQAFPNGPAPDTGVPQNTWAGNTLQLPQGIGELISQSGQPGGGQAVAGAVGGGATGGGGGGFSGGGGGFGGIRSDIQQAFAGLTQADKDYLRQQGFNPDSASSYQDYIFATYGGGPSAPVASTQSFTPSAPVAGAPVTQQPLPTMAPAMPVTGMAQTPAMGGGGGFGGGGAGSFRLR